jgi:uncharacterized membrane protein
MFPVLLPLFHWVDTSWLSREIRASTWQFAIFEMIHLLGLTMVLGSLMVLDLRLLGVGMRRLRVAKLARDLSAWMRSGLAVILLSGMLLFFGEPMKLYGSPWFHVKMVLLALAILFQFTVLRGVTNGKKASPILSKLAAVVSLVLWFGVGLAGRGIGFLG